MMSDLIRRENAINALYNEKRNLLAMDADRVANGVQVSIKVIESLPSADRPQEWIPCSERLPSEYGNYLITTEDGEVDVGAYDPDSGLKWSGCDADGFYWFSNGAILAWMPLPKPWKGADDE